VGKRLHGRAAKLESEVEAIEKQKGGDARCVHQGSPSSAFSLTLSQGRAVMGDYEKVSKGYALL